MNIKNLKNKAVCIENANQERRFTHFCSKMNIYEPRKNSSLSYPYYMMITETNAGQYVIPNRILEGEDNAVLESGYIPITMKQFEGYFRNWEKEANEKESNEENS